MTSMAPCPQSPLNELPLKTRSPLIEISPLKTGMVVFLTIVAVSMSTSAQELQHRLDLGAGIHLPFDDVHREIYGVAPSVLVGYTGHHHGRSVFIETGLALNQGLIRPEDPTFEMEAHYALVPLRVGLRVDPTYHDDWRVRVQLGVTFEWAMLWSSDVTRTETDETPLVGLGFEFRPEVRLNERWNLWIAQRLAIAQGTSRNGFNHSGASTLLGLSLGGS